MLVDIILLAVLTLTIMIYFKNGFAVSLFNTASTVIAVAFIAVFHGSLTQLVKDSKFGIWLYERVNNRVGEMIATHTIQGAPGFLQDMIDSGIDSVNQMVLDLSDKLLGIAIAVVVFVLMLVVFKIIGKVFPKIIKAFVGLPIIKQVDKLLGGVLGIVVGALWMIIAVYALGLISLIPSLAFIDEQLAGSFILNAIQNTYIGELLF